MSATILNSYVGLRGEKEFLNAEENLTAVRRIWILAAIADGEKEVYGLMGQISITIGLAESALHSASKGIKKMSVEKLKDMTGCAPQEADEAAKNELDTLYEYQMAKENALGNNALPSSSGRYLAMAEILLDPSNKQPASKKRALLHLMFGEMECLLMWCLNNIRRVKDKSDHVKEQFTQLYAIDSVQKEKFREKIERRTKKAKQMIDLDDSDDFASIASTDTSTGSTQSGDDESQGK